MVANLKKRIILIVCCIIMAGVIAGLIVGNVACFSNYNILTSFFGGFGLSDDSDEAREARQEGNMLAAAVMEDGAVLLKNNGALPLKNKKVNVFGWASTDKGFIPQGTGSGTGARNDLVTFLGGLKAAGIEYNETLAADYAALDMRRVENESGNYTIEVGTDQDYKLNYGVVEASDSFLTEDRMNQAKAYSDTAVVVIGRLLGEGNDYSKKQYIKYGENDETRILQAISVTEQAMLDRVGSAFENVVVVLNTTNPMEAGFLNSDLVDAAIYMGTPGTRGTVGLANLLAGEATPSGHLTDTWAYDFSTAPSFATSGREGVGRYTDSGSAKVAYSDYIEDIYVGYKWYETADADGFWDTQNAKDRWHISNGYRDVVQYPFGFGLSYTTFEWTVTELGIPSGTELKADDYITVEVEVKNTGTRTGKDVVQLYYSAPYTTGGIEKSAINLGAFAKTTDIEPGDSDFVYLELPVEDMKSYDCYDRNNNGFMGYELEGGSYTLTLRTDVHTLAPVVDGRNTFAYTVPAEGFRYATDSVTTEPVVNRFTTYTNPTSGATSTIDERVAKKAHSIDGSEENAVTYLTRGDFAGTFPYEKPEDRAMGALRDDTMYVTVDPVNNPDDTEPEFGFGSSATSWTMDDMLGVEYGDRMWDEIVSQLTLREQMTLIAQGGFGTIDLSEQIGMPKTVASDGPSGFNNKVTGQNDLKAVNYPCATIIASSWDFDTAYSVGLAIGGEGFALGLQGWYGPGANLHRSPLGGRNFEYYSEDPRLSGIMVAYEVMGAKEKGVTAYIKHIAVNDSDTGRNGAYKWLTEQALRESYLLPFELAVKVGYSNAMMSSVDRIGSTRVSGSYALLTGVLRDEWGFCGAVITDYYQSSASSRPLERVHDVDECIRAGNSQLLHPDGSPDWFDDDRSATAKQAISKSAKDILFAYSDTLFFAEIAGQDVDLRKTPEVFPWWIILLVGIDVMVIGLLGFWLFMLLRKKKPKAERVSVGGAATAATESAETLFEPETEESLFALAEEETTPAMPEEAPPIALPVEEPKKGEEAPAAEKPPQEESPQEGTLQEGSLRSEPPSPEVKEETATPEPKQRKKPAAKQTKQRTQSATLREKVEKLEKEVKELKTGAQKPSASEKGKTSSRTSPTKKKK